MSNSIYPNLILEALSKVRYPGTGKNLVESGMVEDDIRIDGRKVSFSLIFDKPNSPFVKSVVKAAEAAILQYVGQDVDIKGNISVNSVGLYWAGIWSSDCYFDYLPHFLEGMAAWPEIIPDGTDHIFSTTSMMKDVQYAPGSVKYSALDADGTERIKLSFKPKVLSNGKPLQKSQWKFGTWMGCYNILTINRKGVADIEIVSE